MQYAGKADTLVTDGKAYKKQNVTPVLSASLTPLRAASDWSVLVVGSCA